VEVAFALLAIVATVIAVTALAERIGVSAPLLLMLVGVGASFLPFIDEPQLSSDLILLGFLPPLLYAAALRTSVIDFHANRRAIALLSVLLVVVTALGVGLITWWLLPVPFAVAFCLGAVVAPPDAVAATTIARRVGLPRRLVTILEGESLVNDATAITCLRVGLAAIAATVGVVDVTLGFLTAAAGGVLTGLVVAWLAVLIRKRINEPVFDTAVSLLVPFAAYLPAEEITYKDFHGSGVVAVVVAGLILGHKSPVIQNGRSRLAERVNWATIQFLLENTVFLLIGLQARRVVLDLQRSDLSGWMIAWFCVAILLAVIVIRLLWLLATRHVLLPHDERRTQRMSLSHSLVVGWAGLRGVVTLAAALLIPPTVEHRDVLVFGAMVVTAGTLLLQGLTLPALVRALHLQGPDARSDALQAATVLQTASTAALEQLDRLRREHDDDEILEHVRKRIRDRPEALWERLGSPDQETPADAYRRLRLATLKVEREEVLRVRGMGHVDHDVIENVLAALDIEESMILMATARTDELMESGTVVTPEHPQGPCDELQRAERDVQPLSDRCQDCEREGTRTVHLRLCLECGNVGCCDSSQARHASRHFQETGHPVLRSFESGEEWRWCFIHERIG
jgi:monovalent cation/hydrogen antiporter